MSLKLTLKPGEKVIIGTALITNGNTTAKIFVENKVPLLREKDILPESKVKTAGERIYYAIQLMYFDRDNLASHHKMYWRLVKEFIGAAPSAIGYITEISELVAVEKYYPALKVAKRLREYEQEAIKHAKESI